MSREFNEAFFSVQGEGVDIGKFVFFVRFQGCNLSCEFCDTKRALSGAGNLTLEEVLGMVEVRPPGVCITGGEPLLKPALLARLVEELVGRWERPPEITLETNGTLLSAGFLSSTARHLANVVVSPKFDQFPRAKYLEVFREAFGGLGVAGSGGGPRVTFKFLLDQPGDLETALSFLGDAFEFLPGEPWDGRYEVVFQPVDWGGIGGGSPAERYRDLYLHLLDAYGASPEGSLLHQVAWRLLPQLHKVCLFADLEGKT
ncbi:MAG: 7-carboxy-7-deazaguanine synthase QueE [Promethearchaeota archaeon]